MSRRSAREQAFKLIYERCVDGEPSDFSLQLAIEQYDSEDSVYIQKVYNGVIEKYDCLKGIVQRFSRGFDYDRIYKIDCALLLLSTYEILFLNDIPEKVSVNEALDLAKIYSTEKSVPFINGILGSVISQKETLLNEQDN